MPPTHHEEREQVLLNCEGKKIFGIIHIPNPKNAQYPAVLVCHGLAGNKAGRYRIYVDLAEQLSALGIVALRIDFRGAGDSEGAFEDMTIKGSIKDAAVALDFLKTHPSVDPSRMGLFGKSFGGTLALLTARQWTGIKSLGLWAPIFSGDFWADKWKLYKTNSISPALSEELRRINGQRASNAFFEEFFSLNMEPLLPSLKKIPVLHIHGEKDESVTIAQADQYAKQLSRWEGLTKFIRLPDADHDFTDPSDRQIVLNATSTWFHETL